MLFLHLSIYAHNYQPSETFSDSTPNLHLNHYPLKNTQAKPISFFFPGAMLACGVWAINNNDLKKLDQGISNKLYFNNPHARTSIDDYLQYSPAAVAFGLNALGVKGEHKLVDAGIIYLMSNAIMSGAVISLKKTNPRLRPDKSSNNSFPSGHTATAFASAEFLLHEYIDVSPWIGIAGYGAAFLTGYLRVYNNKHWFSDVVAGAGIGVISTKLAYLIYNHVQPRLFKNSPRNTLILPAYQNGSFGVSLVKRLE